MAGSRQIIMTNKLVDALSIPLSGTFTSGTMPLLDWGLEGNFSLQVEVSGSGTCKFEYLSSINGTDFLEPTSASDIASSVTATSGPASDGKNIYSFTPVVSPYMKIKVTETGGASAVVVSAWLAMH